MTQQGEPGNTTPPACNQGQRPSTIRSGRTAYAEAAEQSRLVHLALRHKEGGGGEEQWNRGNETKTGKGDETPRQFSVILNNTNPTEEGGGRYWLWVVQPSLLQVCGL